MKLRGVKMKKFLILVLVLIILFSCAGFRNESGQDKTGEKVCVLNTNYGTMTFKFFEDDAPNTCRQIQKVVEGGYYNGKIFYRVVKGHVLQTDDGGDSGSPNLQPEFNENPHIVGTVGLGRGREIDSGNTEIYICLAPRPHLDGKYTVFGQLIEGLDVLEKIGNVEVDEKWVGSGERKIAVHKPKKPVVIEKAFIEMRVLKE